MCYMDDPDPDSKLKILAELTARAQESSHDDADFSEQYAHAPQSRVQGKPGKAANAASRYQARELLDCSFSWCSASPCLAPCITDMTHHKYRQGMSPYQALLSQSRSYI